MYYLKLCSFLKQFNMLIKSDTELPINLIKKIYFGFVLQDITECEARIYDNSFMVEIKKDNLRYKLKEENEHFDLTENDLIFLLYDLIEKHLTMLNLQNYSIFHGAALGMNDLSIGMVATTRTGKSTLAAYMADNGYDYLSDDNIIVNRSNHTVFPFLLPISLRSMDLLGSDYEGKIVYQGFNQYRNEYNYLIVPNCSKNYLKLPKLKAIIFLIRGRSLKLEKLAKSASYINLLNNIKFSKDIDSEIRNMVAFSNGIDCYNLFYNDLEEALISIKKVFL